MILSKTDERAEEQMLKKWYAKLLVLLAVVCAVAAAHPAAQAEAIPEETAQEQSEADVTILASGTCGAEGDGSNLQWELDSNGTLRISGSGAMKDYDYYKRGVAAPWYEYKEQIKSLTIASGITSIGNYTFYDCSGLTSITLPEGLTSIGICAFFECTGLTGITFPAGFKSIGSDAFNGCSGLTSVTFPDGMTSIGAAAFYGCWRLTSLRFPDSLTSIGEEAFRNCSGLTSLTLPERLTSIDERAFQGCLGLTSITFPKGLTGIGYAAFSGCGGLTSLTLPEGLTWIGANAFSDCWWLTSITFPDSLTSIGSWAFKDCRWLTDITFPASLRSIGQEAFKNCNGLTSLTFPSGLRSIGDGAFRNCSGLTSITLPTGLTSIGDFAFSGCTGLTSLTYPAGLTSDGGWVFSDCTGLTSITFPDGLTSIDEGMFKGCTGLTSLTFPNGLTSIGDYAFSGCTGLTDISFPETLQSIGSEAFYLCGFSKITIPASVTEIGNYGLYSGASGGADIYFSGNAPAVAAADGGKPSFSTDSTLFFDWEKTGWDDSFYYDSLTGKWNGYKTSAANEGLLDYGVCGDSEDGTNLRWKLYKDGSLSISGSGAMAGYAASKIAPWSKYSNSIHTVTVGAGVTSIGAYSFYNNYKKLTAVKLPDSMTSIGKSAFQGCTGLTSVTLPDGLTSISEYAFFGCTGLTSITLPRGLTLLRPSAFAETGITAFASESDKYTVDECGAVYDTSNSLIAYPAGSPQTVYTIQDGTKTIGSYAFYGAAHLDTVIVPDSVSLIGSYAFQGMAELQSVYFIGNKPTINNWAFETDTNHRLKIYHEADETGWSETWWPSQYFELIVWNPHQATGVELDKETLTLALGASQKLTAAVLALAEPDNTAVTWASADVDVAAVFADGTVLGKKAGTTTVTATTVDGGFTASCAVTVEPAPDGVMSVRLDSVCARPGNTVQMRLMLDKNPGFANLSLVIGYDTDIMTLTEVENKVSGAEYTASQKLTANPYMMTWNNGTSNCTATGTLATLTFQIKDTAAYGVYPISVSFYKGNQGTYKDGVNVNYDQSRNALPLVYVGSSAEIRSYIPGDISGDGRVDSRDVLTLLRHLSGWDGIAVVEEALDVNGDGESDFQDVTDLLQYIAGWNVVLH